MICVCVWVYTMYFEPYGDRRIERSDSVDLVGAFGRCLEGNRQA